MSQSLCRCCLGDTSLVVSLLVILFGVASWVDINGLWVELPILVQKLPEGWDLPSYMSVIIQVANVAPLAYTIASSVWPHKRIEVPVVYVIISVGAVSCLLLSFFWDRTSTIAGTEHSTSLLILQFFLALVDCTSSVAFLPFMAVFKPQYMIAYFIGEGCSGLIPSLVSLGQGAGSMECVSAPPGNGTASSVGNSSDNLFTGSTTGAYGNANLSLFISTTAAPESTAQAMVYKFPQYKPPKFTVQIFFLFLTALMVVSLISFILLNYWSYCRKEYVKKPAALTEEETPSLEDHQSDNTVESDPTPMSSLVGYKDAINEEFIKSISYNHNNTDTKHKQRNAPIFNPKRIGSSSQSSSCCQNGKTTKRRDLATQNSSTVSFAGSASSSSSDSEDFKAPTTKKMSKAKYGLFLLITAWVNALLCGVHPAIQTYSCLPYGIRPYHLSVTLSSIANPAACFAALFVKMTSTRMTSLMTLLGSGLSAYVIFTAASSPTPPLVDHQAGGLVVILAWVVVTFFLTYTKVCIAILFRQQGQDQSGQGQASQGQGRRALMWVGAFTQVGALIGAVVIFFIINYFKLFKWGNPCM